MKRMLILGLTLGLVLSFASFNRASAHAHAVVGDYKVEIGFHTEPPLQGELNGLDLFVTNTKTGEAVNGLEETLRAEIIYGGSKKELELQPQSDLDGAYTADILPTAAGDYTWHIFGEINGTPVDITMTSGPDTFSPVEPKSSVSFPGEEPSGLELAAGTSDAARTARVALILGGIGTGLGLIGLVLGFVSFRRNTAASIPASERS